MNALSAYVRAGKDRIEGWLSRVDSQIFYELLIYQNEQGITGSVAEIGLHHGKSFVALCLGLLPGQRAYGIDIFDQQSLNKDHSGYGRRNMLESHLVAFDVDLSCVILDGRSSEYCTAADILKNVGPVRFFSIDGGHWRAVVRQDLALAEQVIAEGGVIALDDFLRPEWPDVSLGFFEWYESHGNKKEEKKIRAFAIGYNKLYLCDQEYTKAYQERLESSAFLRYFLSKHYEFDGHRLPIFQTFPLPEFSIKQRIHEYLKVYHPDWYCAWRQWREK